MNQEIWCVYKGPDLRHAFSTFEKAVNFVSFQTGADKETIKEEEFPSELSKRFSIVRMEVE